ncbi:hypothetical protein AGR7C_Cc110266 [Agrobacterium deltaense Zutra 3/1]|uniref:Uncharacterized protein n=1 Tax=Agrobacterium deltaense Zutra 3/1 TaxID=1183427 RepID=A0A1S7P2P4_9HYPH|nr:hypothetical protein AGR7C_Cc110266 [Agrobacterium deltaense Zutra 3/1]
MRALKGKPSLAFVKECPSTSHDVSGLRFGSRWITPRTFLVIGPHPKVRSGLVTSALTFNGSGRVSELDFHVNASSEVELHQSIDSLRGGVNDIEKTLVRPHFELFTALLVNVRRAVDGKLFDAGGERNRAANAGAGALCGRHDFTGRGIEDPVIERLEADTDILAVHSSCPCSLLFVSARGNT